MFMGLAAFAPARFGDQAVTVAQRSVRGVAYSH
jgi:hypothetical protein